MKPMKTKILNKHVQGSFIFRYNGLAMEIGLLVVAIDVHMVMIQV
jgi:hypothetical protein